MDPGPSSGEGEPQVVPGIDFLKNSYDMAITESSKVATIKSFLESERDKAMASLSGNAAIGLKTRFDMFITKIGQPFEELFSGMNPQRVQNYRRVLEDGINLTRGEVANEDASPPESALNTTTASDVGGKRRRKTRKHKKSGRKSSSSNSSASHRRTRKH
jgi:hypothetical protein